MNKKAVYASSAAAGIVCLLIGLFVITDPALKLLSGLLTGLGSAVAATGLGNLIWQIAVPRAKREEQQRIKDIEVNDERNIRIREKAGEASNRIVLYILCAAELVFGLFGDIRAVLIIAGILVLQLMLGVALPAYYSKRI